MKYLAAVLLLVASSAVAEPCRGFAVAWQDELGNVTTGFPHGVDVKFKNKLSKKYGDLCYDPQASTILFMWSRRAIYQGAQARTSTSTEEFPVTGNGQSTFGEYPGTNNGTLQTTTTMISESPYSADYQLLYLTIEREINGKRVVVQSFSGKTLHPTLYGVCTRNCHPSAALIKQGLDWLSANRGTM
jgi:hypothetical protein